MKKCGIYKITSPNGKIYIGQSIDINLRWHHYKLLRNKNQKKLFASFLKHGVDNHTFEILELCNREKLNLLEKYFVDLYKTFGTKHGLNIKDGGGHSAKRRIYPPNEKIFCACKCGKKFWKYDEFHRVRKYIKGHNQQKKPIVNKIKSVIKNRSKTISEIINACIGHSSKDVKTVLCRLVSNGNIVRVSRGMYAKTGTPTIKRSNPIIKCACGCKKKFKKYDKGWRERKFISGHNFKLNNNGKRQ